MGRKRHTAEQIIAKLREAEVELAKGLTTGDVVRKLGVTEQTYCLSEVPRSDSCSEAVSRKEIRARGDSLLLGGLLEDSLGSPILAGARPNIAAFIVCEEELVLELIVDSLDHFTLRRPETVISDLQIASSLSEPPTLSIESRFCSRYQNRFDLIQSGRRG